MPRYRVEALSWIAGRSVQRGEEIEYAGIPGSKLTPLDDAAKAAKAAAGPGRANSTGRPSLAPQPTLAPVDANPEKPALVEIPADWEDLNPEQRINLARKLGAPVKGTNAKAADAHIKAEIANRATV
jgi:hypothetical protein